MQNLKGGVLVLSIILSTLINCTKAFEGQNSQLTPPPTFVRRTIQDDLEEGKRLLEKVMFDLTHLDAHYNCLEKIHSYMEEHNEPIKPLMDKYFPNSKLEEVNLSNEELTKLFWAVGVTHFLHALLEERWEKIQWVTYRLSRAETIFDNIDCKDFTQWSSNDQKAYQFINQQISEVYQRKDELGKKLDQILLNFKEG